MATRLGFMFAGQGAQSVGMGQDLADSSAAARQVFAAADAALGRGISELCFHGPLAELTTSANCQPAIYTMSLASLAAFRERCSYDPIVCGGLSLGEFAALTAAGALGFAEGLRLVAARGRLMGEACRTTDGAMAAVLNADPDLVAATCAEHGVDVANYNCPGQIVISGRAVQVQSTVDALSAAGVARIIPLTVDGAFHSRLMAPAAAEFAPILAEAVFSPPSCTLVQNYAGGAASDPVEIRRNLELQVTGSVRWEACARAMLAEGIDALIEFGPGKVLSGFMRRIDRAFPTYSIGTGAELEKVLSVVC